MDVEHDFSPDWQARIRLTDSRLIRDMLVRQIYAAVPPNRQTGMAPIYNTTLTPDRKAKAIDAQVTGHADLGGWDADFVAGYSRTRGVLHRTDTTKNEPTILLANWNGEFAPLKDWSGASVVQRRTTERESSLYGTARLRPLDGLSVILGTNFTTYKLRDVVNGTLSRKLDESGKFVPCAGVVYHFAKNLSVYASYTQIFSPASVYDADDKVLDPVTGNNYEAGIKGEFLGGKLNTSIAGFLIKQNNVAVAVPGATGPAIAQTARGQTRRYAGTGRSGRILHTLNAIRVNVGRKPPGSL
ncbi:MAG: TonB-dependent receptor [Novosphingobium sp.]|nr:TonB-dependent receptor [Novosphingobium sp.]